MNTGDFGGRIIRTLEPLYIVDFYYRYSMVAALSESSLCLVNINCPEYLK